MIDEFAKEYLHSDLREVREVMLWKLNGLSEYDIRRPLTVTGTNLLGLIKHLATWEARYFGEVFRPTLPPASGPAERPRPARHRAVGHRGRDTRGDHRLLSAGMGTLRRNNRRPARRRSRPCAMVAAPGGKAIQHSGPRAHRDQPARRARRHPARTARRHNRNHRRVPP